LACHSAPQFKPEAVVIGVEVRRQRHLAHPSGGGGIGNLPGAVGIAETKKVRTVAVHRVAVVVPKDLGIGVSRISRRLGECRRRQPIVRSAGIKLPKSILAEAVPDIVAGVRIGPLAGEKHVVGIMVIDVSRIADIRVVTELQVVGVMEIDRLPRGAGGQKRGKQR